MFVKKASKNMNKMLQGGHKKRPVKTGLGLISEGNYYLAAHAHDAGTALAPSPEASVNLP